MTRWKKEIERFPGSRLAIDWNAADYDGDGNTRYPFRERVYSFVGWSNDRGGFRILDQIARARQQRDMIAWKYAVATYDRATFNCRIDPIVNLPG